jgi:hypothetical protein
MRAQGLDRRALPGVEEVSFSKTWLNLIVYDFDGRVIKGGWWAKKA